MVKNSLKKININDITPSDYNPRKISEKDFEKLKKSLDEFGLVDPIIINLNTNNIIGGHQRFDVLYNEDNNRDLYLIELGDIGWVLDETNLKIKDEAHEKALNLALNRMGGEFDIEKLNPLLDELEELDLGELTGFDLDLEEIPYDIEVVYSDDEDEEDDGEDDYFYEIETKDNDKTGDSSKPVQTPNKSIKYGEIYKIKNNIIMYSDSDDSDNLDELMKLEEEKLILDESDLELIKTIDVSFNYYTTSNPRVLEELVENYQGTDNFTRLK